MEWREAFYSSTLGSSPKENLHDWELGGTVCLLDILADVQLSHNEDAGVWIRDTSGVFSCKSFPSCLSSTPLYPSFPIVNFLWNSKVLIKLRAFV